MIWCLCSWMHRGSPEHVSVCTYLLRACVCVCVCVCGSGCVTCVVSLSLCLLQLQVNHSVMIVPPICASLLVQGGLTLARVLSLLRQAIAALLHLHSLGILHRDLRAANVLIDALDPFRVLVADLGVSHLLSAFASGEVYKGASKITSVVTGNAALGPLQVGIICLCGFRCMPPMGLCSLDVLSTLSMSYPVLSWCCACTVDGPRGARG